MQAAAVAPSIIAGDVNFIRFREGLAPYACPPPQYALSGKFCSIMVSSKIHNPCLVIQYINSIRGSLSELQDAAD